MSEEKKGEASGIPVELTDWNSHMDILSDVVQLPIGPDDEAKDVALIGYVAPTYENGVANGFVGTNEEWNELVAKHRAEAPKEGYIEQMVVETHSPESFRELLKEMTTPKEGADTASIAVGRVESFASSNEPTDVAGKLSEVSEQGSITAISPEEQGVAIAKAALGEPCVGHFLVLDENGDPSPEGAVDVMKGLTSLDQIFPIRTAHPLDTPPAWAVSLIKFFNLVCADFQFKAIIHNPLIGLSYPEDLRIFRYSGMDGDQQTSWFRFQFTDLVSGEVSRSFVVLDKDVKTFLTEMEGENPMAWTHQRRRSEKGYGLNVTQAPIELPLSFFPFSFAKSPIDDLFDGDFTLVSEVCERMNADLRGRLAELNRIAVKLADLIKEKDHDLYLSFKGVNGLKEMNVALDRVYPRLPESGEIVLGDEPINLFEWSGYSKVVQVNVKRISHGTRQINRMFEKYRGMINPHPMIQEIFDTNLKEQLMASSHFLNRVYGFSASYGVKYMEEVANEVIGKLNARGGNIGLDLNEWVVYEYHEEGRPTPIEDEALDFKKLILNSYTQSFVDALYGYLLDVQNPYIKPYTYRTVVEGDDGIEIGSIRQVD